MLEGRVSTRSSRVPEVARDALPAAMDGESESMMVGAEELSTTELSCLVQASESGWRPDTTRVSYRAPKNDVVVTNKTRAVPRNV